MRTAFRGKLAGQIMTRPGQMDDPGASALQFRGGFAGALAPFGVFLAGVAWLGLSGAPDERGFWPVLLAAIALGLALAHDRQRYCETLVAGMSQPLVLLMIMAWLLAGVFAAVVRASGLIDGLVFVADGLGVSGAGFVLAAFGIACLVSSATGTSLGTLILCIPLLYPAGVALGAAPAVLVGAILGGATFGDNVSPVSDTTIASAATQGADLGGVVRSRLRYALPAAMLAVIAYALLGSGSEIASAQTPVRDAGGPQALPMLLAPTLVIFLLLRRRHLIEGLLTGIVVAAALGVGLGLIAPAEILYIDAERFSARGLLVDGMERGLGVSVFTLLLMGLVATLEDSGVLGHQLKAVQERITSPRGAEGWSFATVSAAVLLTTHSTVAILAVGSFVRRVGESFGIGPYRRANLLDVTVCTYPFLLPYCIPTILAASLTTGSGAQPVSAFAAGLHNLHSWALLVVLLVAIATGAGRGLEESASKSPASKSPTH